MCLCVCVHVCVCILTDEFFTSFMTSLRFNVVLMFIHAAEQGVLSSKARVCLVFSWIVVVHIDMLRNWEVPPAMLLMSLLSLLFPGC